MDPQVISFKPVGGNVCVWWLEAVKDLKVVLYGLEKLPEEVDGKVVERKYQERRAKTIVTIVVAISNDDILGPLSEGFLGKMMGSDKPLELLQAEVALVRWREWRHSRAELLMLWESLEWSFRRIADSWKLAMGSAREKAELVETFVPLGTFRAAWKSLLVGAEVKDEDCISMLVDFDRDRLEKLPPVAKSLTSAPPSVVAVAPKGLCPVCKTAHMPKCCSVCKKRHAPGSPYCCRVCLKAHFPYCSKSVSKRDDGKYPLVLLSGGAATEVKVGIFGEVVDGLLDSGAWFCCIERGRAIDLGLPVCLLDNPFEAASASGVMTVDCSTMIPLRLGGVTLKWPAYVVQSLPVPLVLGADLLFAEDVIYDTLNRKLSWRGGQPVSFRVNVAPGQLSVAVITSADVKVGAAFEHKRPEIVKLLNEYEDVFSDDLDQCGASDCPPIRVELKADAPKTAWVPPRPLESLSDAEREAMDEFVDNGLRTGLLRTVAPDEPLDFNFNHVFAPKKDGGVRVCANLQHINDILVLPPQIIPRLKEMLHRPPGAKVMSKFDFTSAYSQCRLHPESMKYFTFMWSKHMVEIEIQGLIRCHRPQ